MKYIVALFVAISLFYVVVSVPSFGTYSCATVRYPIQNSAAVPAGSYSIAARNGSAGTFEVKLGFNLSSTATGNVYTPYFTVYTGQTYYILQGGSTTVTIIDTAPNFTTCPQTLTSFADEVTRIINLQRGNSTAFRNTYLDQAAAGYVSNGALTIPAAYLNYTAPGAATISFIAGTGNLVNPGAIVQSLLDSNVGNASYTPREVGVFFNETAKSIALVFATRNIFCGNGIVDGNETCDDNNAISGDGCSSICQVEAGYTCTQSYLQPISVCTSGAAVSPSASSASTTASTAASSASTTASTAASSAAATSGSNSPVSASRSSTAPTSASSSNIAASGSGSNTPASPTPAASSIIPSLTSNPTTATPTSTFIEPSYATNPTTGSAVTLASWMKVLF